MNEDGHITYSDERGGVGRTKKPRITRVTNDNYWQNVEVFHDAVKRLATKPEAIENYSHTERRTEYLTRNPYMNGNKSSARRWCGTYS